ncbi:ligase-associated DNA damage response DEXH box helicase [Methylobacterium haplocladii]|uniref:DEAD/DEAH box helicase n=1 Tax=Methylobacterium haplocladii TaxID=1176176 RepID=A0A512IP61_9HYPH|nr:ligase-associated DNA damage response DEXH box helicase [Methylobacterium haplocladii]GEO99493.1 DEAD/DEAH box helicase [Methylobacterium haplocladii]GJD84546.1 ATP-dependent RNA helicase SrmB [Methylobacterium haplocladii]GLS59769.1 DEAD/DEAH box helicase [Methylobacterium haplocladii]
MPSSSTSPTTSGTPRREAAGPLPAAFAAWFAGRGWQPRAHQLDLLGTARAGRSALLVAPTGAGKTLAGFLPSLVGLSEAGPRKKPRLHTLYVSPLKALAVDIARNLDAPIAEMGLDIRVETRTGDTPSHKRTRQVARPPDILLTTPEQLSLLLAHAQAADLFGGLRHIVLDELHALVTSKRGDLLSLALARLRRLSPGATTIGLSATVREPDALRRYLVGQGVAAAISLPSAGEGGPRSGSGEGSDGSGEGAPLSGTSLTRGPPSPGEGGGPGGSMADLIVVQGGAKADLHMLDTGLTLPLAGHTAWQSMPAIYELIRAHRTVLVFVNTRLQAEYTFQELWRLNDDTLSIAIHHGSLDAAQRRRVEAAMAAGQLRAIVCTATLDLGIDWGDVDLVVNIGAPKGASRIMQRIGRANHRMDEPSKAYLVPGNRFEMLECRAALDAVEEAAQDTPDVRLGGLDVLAQHVLGMACADAFDANDLFDEIVSAAPYQWLTWEMFEMVVDYVATGGYALRAYERFAKILRGPDGLWRVRDARIAQQYRMNVGTIVEAARVKVRLTRHLRGKPGTVVPKSGRVLGEIEEEFGETLTVGDTFLFAGEILRFEGLSEDECLVTRAKGAEDPAIPSYAGSKFPLSTFLAARVRAIIADPFEWDRLPPQLAKYLLQQRKHSILPGEKDLLVETFPRGNRFYLTAFPFEGRLAHQTLGMLLTRRLERAGLRPLGFAANDYGIAIWTSRDVGERIAMAPGFTQALFDEDMLGDDLEAWLDESAMMKRTFRQCAVIAGLIERRYPGQKKTGRQVTISTDLIYDVLRKHQPDHLLLQAARQDAATGLLDVARLGMMLRRIKGRITHKALDRVSPLSVSVMLEIGRERVYGEGADEILAEAEAELLGEALA